MHVVTHPTVRWTRCEYIFVFHFLSHIYVQYRWITNKYFVDFHIYCCLYNLRVSITLHFETFPLYQTCSQCVIKIYIICCLSTRSVFRMEMLIMGIHIGLSGIRDNSYDMWSSQYRVCLLWLNENILFVVFIRSLPSSHFTWTNYFEKLFVCFALHALRREGTFY